jgi:hypothetical protein
MKTPLQTLIGATAILAGEAIADECPPEETGYCCDYAQGKRNQPCNICPLKGRNLTDSEREMIFRHNAKCAATGSERNENE